MKDTRLILVEGLPASGKSTTAARIAALLAGQGKNVICVDEGEPNHPADFADYDFPDFVTEREQILAKWKNFVSTAEPDTTYVFNCVFLQNPMCETMMRFGMNLEESQTYIREIAAIIAPPKPVIFYLEQTDIPAAVGSVLPERGDEWLSAVIAYHTEQGYGKAQHLKGLGGYIACLEERQRRELHILQSTGLTYQLLPSRPDTDTLAAALEKTAP